jgi:hypothetical protein
VWSRPAGTTKRPIAPVYTNCETALGKFSRGKGRLISGWGWDGAR